MTSAVPGATRVTRPTSYLKVKDKKLKQKLPMLVPLGLLWMITIDALTRVPAGPLSMSGAVTLATAALCLALSPIVLLTRRKAPQSSSTPWPLIAFILLAAIGLMMSPSADGLQNVAVYLTFVLAIGITSVQATAATTDVMMRRMRIIAVAVTLAYLGASLAGVDIIGERSFGLIGLIFLAVLIPHKPTNRLARLAPFFVTAVIAYSLSRTATVIAVGLLIFMSLRNRKGFRFAGSFVMAAIAGAVAYWLFNFYAPFRDRFLEGDGGATVGGVQLNTSGRAILWDLTYRSSQDSPVWGQGPGSASALITPMFRNIHHPHNEYLRVLHDFGWMGLILFSLGFLMLIWKVASRARFSNNPIHWSALLGIFAVLASSITDNAIIYPFVMLPLGILVGASLALPKEARPQRAAAAPKIPHTYRHLAARTEAEGRGQ